MKRIGWLMAALVVVVCPLFAADRPTDKDIKALVARIEQGRDKFDDALDGKLRNSVIPGPSGEVNVKDALNDFQESIDRLEERLKPEYAASAEAAALLRRASSIDAFFRGQPPGTKGESEWNRLAGDLKTLAAAYGTDFPLGSNATVKRIGDRELATAAEQVAALGDQLKKSFDVDLKKDPTLDKSAKQTVVTEVDQLSKSAKALRDRVKDGKPSSAEAEALLAQASKIQAFIDGHQVPASRSAWTSGAGQLQMVAGAYGSSWPR